MRRFELSEDSDEVLVVHDDGRVRKSPLPVGVDPDTFRNALAAVDGLYRRNGIVPDIEEVYKSWPKIQKKTYGRLYAMDEFRKALELRGISMEQGQGLNEQQWMTILLLSDPTDRRVTSTKLRQLGISMPKYQAWMRNPLFAQILKERSEQNLGDAVSVAINRLVGNAEAGDQRAIEKVLEISGRYHPQNAELQNARQVILSIVEIVLRHVQDREVRRAIMEDITATSKVITEAGPDKKEIA